MERKKTEEERYGKKVLRWKRKTRERRGKSDGRAINKEL